MFASEHFSGGRYDATIKAIHEGFLRLRKGTLRMQLADLIKEFESQLPGASAARNDSPIEDHPKVKGTASEIISNAVREDAKRIYWKPKDWYENYDLKPSTVASCAAYKQFKALADKASGGILEGFSVERGVDLSTRFDKTTGVVQSNARHTELDRNGNRFIRRQTNVTAGQWNGDAIYGEDTAFYQDDE